MTTYPLYTIGFVIHALKAPSDRSVRKHNTDLLEILVSGKCDIDTEVTLRFDKGQRSGRRQLGETNYT